MASFVENINILASKIGIVEEANSIFDEGVIPVLEEIAELDLNEAVADLKKGNYLGNRKIDINLSLNMVGIAEDTDADIAEAIWTDPTKTVQYSSASILFVDGVVVNVPFVFDGNPITISTHGDLLIQLNNNAEFLAKLEDTLIAGFATGVVGEIVRIYDVIGSNSNIERITLTASSGSYIEENPMYYWAKSTSAFQTLSMRAGDIIKIGNEIDNVILLANSIEQLLELQSRIPQFIDTFVDEVAQGDVTIYNKLTELQAIYDDLTNILRVHTSIDNIDAVAGDIANIDTVATAVVPVLATILDAENQANIAIANADLAVEAKEGAETAQLAAEAAAADATAKNEEIKNVSVAQTITGAAGTSASVVYNPVTGKFTFIVPQGYKGDKGDSFDVNAVGLIANRGIYDAQPSGFSFLATDESSIYFKLSATSGDWSSGAPFGKGETGATGEAGKGIASIVKTGTVGIVDTYTITYTDTSTTTFEVTNGSTDAVDVAVDVSGFSKNLSVSDTTVQHALNTLDAMVTLPEQAGNAGKFLRTDGTTATWQDNSIAAPTITISTTVNENSNTNGKVNLEDYSGTIFVEALYGTISALNQADGTFIYTAVDIVDGLNKTDQITTYYKLGSMLSETSLPTNMTIVVVPEMPDDTIQVVDFSDDLETNEGWTI